ncbi:peroxidasin homolog [Copidosoma floridanum]|uniref:peroxidasin homolog n=1 Tax=Copidosoma floridanum TaxID=29053 RepID=UPI000C6FC886|nr:peroxidasin homolog [Copidosoma floridanum]
MTRRTAGLVRTSLALLGLVVAASTVTTQNRLFDVNDYVYGVDIDLQARARAAIEAERFTLQSNNRERSEKEPCRLRQERPCPPSKYRTPSGACNNVRHPAWGARGSPYLRVLPPAYTNGVEKPFSSLSNHALPSSAEVVTQFRSNHRNSAAPHEGLSSLTGVWSELLLRDISDPVRPKHNENCCQPNFSHPECMPGLDVSGNCLNYWRAVPTLSTHSCNFKTREQMNGASGYLDGSDIYGNNDNRLHKLRTYHGGRVNLATCELCNKPNSSIGLIYQTLLTEHNRIADKLAEINGHWDDTRLYLEARRAVVAQLQHVTLNEYAPSILGEAVFADQELMPQTSGFYKGYSSTNRGGAIDAVSLAALQALTSIKSFESSALEQQVILAAKRVSLDVAEQEPSTEWDLSSLLIHAGRDHGLPSYIKFVEYCSNGRVKFENFTSLTSIMEPKDVELLENIYSRVEYIDLLLGGILEIPNEGAAVGPTFGCLLREQFIKLRNSDRFWYENDIPPSSLKLEQITEIRKVSLAGILCINSQIAKIQPKSFIQQDPYLNAKITCEQHGLLDLSAWKEEFAEAAVVDNHMTTTPASEAARTLVAEIDEDMIAHAVKKAEQNFMERKQLEYKSWVEKKIANPKSPAGTAASFSKANKDALLIANTSILYELTTNELINGIDGLRRRRRKRQSFDVGDNVLGFPNNEFNDILQNVDVSGFFPHKVPTNHEEVDCPFEDGPCDPTTPYRTFTGHCNNLRNPTLAQSLTTFSRLLPPHYEDGVSKPKVTGVTGAFLPNPRTISTNIHPDISNLHNRYTLMVMQYAQFLDHDMTMTPIQKGFGESIPSCRSCDSARTVHPECNPFVVPPGDHYYPTLNVSSGERLCIPSMRSLPGQQHLGPREQINQNTGLLDGSVVYGENACIAKVLRGFNGLMNITRHPNNGKDLLPQSRTFPECKAPSGYCFIGGDARASEQPGLTAMHTMWVREHNRAMDLLRKANSHWDAEKLFQETRRIVSAMLQHITYNEFLPRILGWNAVNLYGLKLLPQGYYKEYLPTCNPSILNEFATAAFRIGHSLLRPHIPRMDRSYRNIDPPILLRDGFFNPDMLYQPEMIDEIIRGLVATPMETLDQFITGEVTNHLFEQKGIPHSGFDLIALNIQRSRDHGLPPYNQYRALCNLKKATNFDDLSREMAPEVIARLKRVYASVDDIDLFPGGMSERPLQGGLVGPTFACIIAIQFRQARKCDRFWYETDDPNIRFTEPQLAEIRKTTLSKVMCDNMDAHAITEMQRAAFDLPSNFLNPRVPCNSMPTMNFDAWKETRQGCQIGGRNVAIGESGFPTPCTSCVCTNEGTHCASLRVTDCHQLLREASREAILRDDVCTAQCGFVLAATEPAVTSLPFKTAHTFPGFSHTRGNHLRTFASSLNVGFKLPDLSQFIG